MKTQLRKVFTVLLGLMMFSPGWAVDWSGIDFLGDGAGDGKYNNKYKVEKTDCMREAVNVQQPGFAAEAGIYIAFPEAISACSHLGAIEGAGICLYIAQFTAQETEVTVTLVNSGDCVFHVFFADGTTGGGETPSALVRPETKTSIKKSFVHGQLVVEHAGRCYNILGIEMR